VQKGSNRTIKELKRISHKGINRFKQQLKVQIIKFKVQLKVQIQVQIDCKNS